MAENTTKVEPLVSVIIPTYNRAGVVVRAIHSALWQTFANLEVVVIDDASSDSTRHLVELIGDPRLRYLRHNRNQGLSAARNTGIDAANGDYVAFLDDDDLWLPEKLDKQVRCIQEAAKPIGLVHCAFFKCQTEAPFGATVPSTTKMHVGNALLSLLERKTYALPSALLLPIGVIREVGGFDESFVREEDTDLLFRVAVRYPFAFVPEPLVIYSITPHSLMANRQLVTQMRQRLLEKHKALYSAHPCEYAEQMANVAYGYLSLGDRQSATSLLSQARSIDPSNLEVKRVSRRVAHPGLWRLAKRVRHFSGYSKTRRETAA